MVTFFPFLVVEGNVAYVKQELPVTEDVESDLAVFCSQSKLPEVTFG